MQEKQYITDKGEIKDIKSLNSFELVNGLSKYSKIAEQFNVSEFIPHVVIDQDQAVININLLKAELLERLDNRKPEGNEKISVNFVDSDLEDLMNDCEFDWTFKSDRGNDIDIHLYKGDSEDEEELEDNEIEE